MIKTYSAVITTNFSNKQKNWKRKYFFQFFNEFLIPSGLGQEVLFQPKPNCSLTRLESTTTLYDSLYRKCNL